MTEGIVFDIQRYSLQDGPGLRTLVFLKGCPLRCAWCSNPESQQPQPELLYDVNRCTLCGECCQACPKGAIVIRSGALAWNGDLCDTCGACVAACTHSARSIVGSRVTASEVVALVVRDAPFYRRSGGGVTLGGGEPTSQPAFATEVLRLLHMQGVDTAVETCGCATADAFVSVVERADHVFFDIKHADSRHHSALTGAGSETIVSNLNSLLEWHTDVTVRYPLIPGWNDAESDLVAFAALLRGLRREPPVELVPYHRLGEHKYRLLNREYALAGMYACSDETARTACDLLRQRGINCRVLVH
ncbi:MAG: glycyl-radical enzyme activating protein [Dehalococcoidia bacterium]|nr:glycyl-radical enzyme activating protein [Dehalococcoidia bacterium]